MNLLLHPLTWCIVFVVGIIYAVAYVYKKKGILKGILMFQIILLLLYALDCNSMQYFGKIYQFREFFVPILLISIFLTMYLEEYIEYKNSEFKENNKKKFLNITIQYLLVIGFFIFIFL